MRATLRAALSFLLALAPATARAEAEAEADDVDEREGRWGVSAVPRFSFSNDEGVGAGVRGTAFWYRWGEEPYKTAISAQAFVTSRLVQHHFVRVDAVDAFQLPLRVTAELGYFQTLSFSYCGLHVDASCDERAATDAARAAALPGDEAQRFVERYYLVRYLSPYGSAALRLRLKERPHKPELFASWRGTLYQPGELWDGDGDGAPDLETYAGSLYERHHPGGEPGFASVPQLGASVDDRDHEPDPSRGYFLELSLRGASPFAGATWTFAGATLTGLLFVPLLPERRLVLASRYVVDVLVGEAPLVELARIGGSTDALAFGGSDIGRGVRQTRLPGELKAIAQQELRAGLGELSLLEQSFRFGGALFLDAGLIAPSVVDQPRLHLGAGVGLRVVWNEAFVMRVDVAASPTEGLAPFLYTKPGHPF